MNRPEMSAAEFDRQVREKSAELEAWHKATGIEAVCIFGRPNNNAEGNAMLATTVHYVDAIRVMEQMIAKLRGDLNAVAEAARMLAPERTRRIEMLIDELAKLVRAHIDSLGKAGLEIATSAAAQLFADVTFGAMIRMGLPAEPAKRELLTEALSKYPWREAAGNAVLARYPVKGPAI